MSQGPPQGSRLGGQRVWLYIIGVRNMPTTSSLSIVTLVMALAQVCLGLLAENAGEWFFHRYVLHGLGKRHGSLWGYHWNEHHKVARVNQMFDPGYRGWPLQWNTQGKEALSLAALAIAHLPLLPAIPLYVLGMYAGLLLYYQRHRRAHLDPEWAKSRLPWHYEHHMERSDANWCVTWPWFDHIMGTRGNDNADRR